MAVADAVLVERTLAGDLDGFGELHRRYYKRVVQLVLGIVKERSQAEDMVQDAYLSALRGLPRLSDPSLFYPWLCRIAVNRAIEERRRTARRAYWNTPGETREGESLPEAASSEPTVLDHLVRSERAEAVKAALHHLPEGQRAAVVLRFFDELPMRSVAQILGCEEVTARTQVFRGLRRLGALLERTDARAEKNGGAG